MSDSLEKAAQGIIDVRFTPSASDLRAVMRLDPDRPFYILLTVLSRMGAFALAAGLTGLCLWGLGQFTHDPLQDLTLAIGGGLVGLVAFRQLAERSWRRLIRKRLFNPSQPLHVTGDGQALTIEDEHIRSRIVLSGIDRLIRSSTHLVLFRNRASVLALPRAAFERPEIFDAFASFLSSSLAARDAHEPISEKTS